tara:strand:- start:258 stop:410 length:153 start_codon:yes stop_codon:yes gene_type:complete
MTLIGLAGIATCAILFALGVKLSQLWLDKRAQAVIDEQQLIAFCDSEFTR